jgi:hypothetical protein
MTTTIGKAILAAAVVLAVAAGGCGDEKCASESPQVQAVADCRAPAGSSMSYELRLCPTCNQNLTGCTVQIEQEVIFLNPVVEACTNGSSCGPSCLPNPSTCTFTVPNAPNGTTYTVQVYDPGRGGTTTGTLTIADAKSCTLPPLPG